MLCLSNVSIFHKQSTIVRNVSFSLASSTIEVLMGRNGSGKSTLAMALAGSPDYTIGPEALIQLDNIDSMPMSPDERAKAGLFLSFQTPVSITGVQVKQVLKLMTDHLLPSPMPIPAFLTQLKTYADLVGLDHALLERGMNEGFSGGERKRLEMISLLLAHPKYAFLDEIDSGVDVEAIGAMARAIEMARGSFGCGILVITHNRRLIDRLPIDKVSEMHNGTIVRTGDKTLIDEIEGHGYTSTR